MSKDAYIQYLQVKESCLLQLYIKKKKSEGYKNMVIEQLA